MRECNVFNPNESETMKDVIYCNRYNENGQPFYNQMFDMCVQYFVGATKTVSVNNDEYAYNVYYHTVAQLGNIYNYRIKLLYCSGNGHMYVEIAGRKIDEIEYQEFDYREFDNLECDLYYELCNVLSSHEFGEI